MGALCATIAMAADQATEDPLATRQRIVHDRMAQLEDRMFRLSETLAEAEPEQSEKLIKALQRARELLIARDMEETIRLLDNGDVAAAADRQIAIEKDLEDVLRMLLEDPDNTKERQREIERLQAFQRRVEALLQEQRDLKAQADAAPRLAELNAALAAAAERLKDIIKEQESTNAETRKAQSDADAKSLAAPQEQLRQDTETLREDLNDPAKLIAKMAEEAGKAGDGASTPGGRPRLPIPKTPPEDEPPDAHDDHGHEAEDDKQASDQKPDEDSFENAQKRLDQGIGEARESLGQAAAEMKTAERDLKKGSASDAAPMQEKAVESLKRALQQLEREKQEAEKLLDQAKAAAKQRGLKSQADKLAGDMSGGKSGDGKSSGGKKGDGEKGEGQQGGSEPQPPDSGEQNTPDEPPAPGEPNVERAGQHMDEAAEDLDNEAPEDASDDQQKAIDELEQAQRELEQVLEQLRREQQEEILRGLESRFRAMLAKQQQINKDTLTFDEKGAANWTHADELGVAALAEDERRLADDAGAALNILTEDATTIVFPRIVEQMQADILSVADLLRAKTTSASTQSLEAEIVRTLEELIEAVKQMRQQLQSGAGSSGPGGGGGGNDPLLPNSAELKLLRSLQDRLNRQTTEFFDKHGEGQERADDAMLRKLADQQLDVADMARKMNERITGQ